MDSFLDVSFVANLRVAGLLLTNELVGGVSWTREEHIQEDFCQLVTVAGSVNVDVKHPHFKPA